MRRDVRGLLARLEAHAGTEISTPEREAELERRNREMVERMEAHPTGVLALEILDRVIERHGTGDDQGGALVRAILADGDEAELRALDLIGVIGGGGEPLPGDHETLMRALNEEGAN